MDLIMLLFGIAIIGLLVWLITTYIPMPEIFKTAIYIICIIVIILWVLGRLGGAVPNVL